MKTTIYKCDKCGKSDDGKEPELPLWRIGLFVNGHVSGRNPNTIEGDVLVGKQHEWCIDCLKEAGFQFRDTQTGGRLQAAPTLEEDIIRLWNTLMELAPPNQG